MILNEEEFLEALDEHFTKGQGTEMVIVTTEELEAEMRYRFGEDEDLWPF